MILESVFMHDRRDQTCVLRGGIHEGRYLQTTVMDRTIPHTHATASRPPSSVVRCWGSTCAGAGRWLYNAPAGAAGRFRRSAAADTRSPAFIASQLLFIVVILHSPRLMTPVSAAMTDLDSLEALELLGRLAGQTQQPSAIHFRWAAACCMPHWCARTPPRLLLFVCFSCSLWIICVPRYSWHAWEGLSLGAVRLLTRSRALTACLLTLTSKSLSVCGTYLSAPAPGAHHRKPVTQMKGKSAAKAKPSSSGAPVPVAGRSGVEIAPAAAKGAKEAAEGANAATSRAVSHRVGLIWSHMLKPPR